MWQARWGSGIVVLLCLACASTGEEGNTTSSAVATATPTDAAPTVVLETSIGEIVLELFPDSAPASVANFLQHVRGGFYDGVIFHRVRPGFMIQAGAVTADMQRRTSSVFPIVNEADNGLRNLRGALAMARTSDPHSATSEFFINLVDNSQLDFTERTTRGWGYAVFGRVTAGMEVVDSVAAIPTVRRARYEAWPTEPVTITRARVR